MSTIYCHRQRGTVILASIGAGFVLCVALAFVPDVGKAGRIIMAATAAFLAIAAWLFASLTVTVGDGTVEARFGPGLIRKRWALAEFTSLAVVRNHWWYGWGIRLIPSGWLYNVSGFEAVEMTRPNGRVLRIGTDEPGALAAALRQAMGQTG